MMRSPYELKILEWDEKPQSNKETVLFSHDILKNLVLLWGFQNID